MTQGNINVGMSVKVGVKIDFCSARSSSALLLPSFSYAPQYACVIPLPSSLFLYCNTNMHIVIVASTP